MKRTVSKHTGLAEDKIISEAIKPVQAGDIDSLSLAEPPLALSTSGVFKEHEADPNEVANIKQGNGSSALSKSKKKNEAEAEILEKEFSRKTGQEYISASKQLTSLVQRCLDKEGTFDKIAEKTSLSKTTIFNMYQGNMSRIKSLAMLCLGMGLDWRKEIDCIVSAAVDDIIEKYDFVNFDSSYSHKLLPETGESEAITVDCFSEICETDRRYLIELSRLPREEFELVKNILDLDRDKRRKIADVVSLLV